MQFGLIRYALALAVSAYASICDLREREVSDWVWLLACPAGLALTMVDLVAGWVPVQTLLVSVAFSLILGTCLLYLGFYGGADAKALLFIALTVPAYPAGFNPVLGDLAGLPVLAVFCNSVLLSAAYPFAVFTINIADILRGEKPFRGIEANMPGKLVLLFTVRRVSLDRLDGSLRYFPAERVVEEDGRLTRKPLHFVHAEADVSALVEALKENRELYADGVLASPTIPMIVFFTLGNLVLYIAGLVVNTAGFHP